MKKEKILIGNSCGKRWVEKTPTSKKNKNKRYIILATVQPIHSVTGTIDFPDDIPGIIARAQEISDACATSTKVATPAIVIKATNLTITNYDGADTGNRPYMFKLMNNNIQNTLLAPYQAAADADPGNSISIFKSGKFNVKTQPARKEGIFEGEAGTAKGSVDLSTPGGPQNKAHLHKWYGSQDGETFTLVDATNRAKVTLTGYISGKQAFFMEELSIQDVSQGLSQIIAVWIQ